MRPRRSTSPLPLAASPKPARTLLARVLFAVVLVWALGLRTWHLDRPYFWVDEAESAVNALTILDHGVPVDHYLGLPIYENTLNQPWPGHPEYEFEDSSYSDKGLTIYHGWFPLYCMAASIAANGIEPDAAPADPMAAPVVRHDGMWMSRLTRAARLPAVVFGMVFLVLLFVTAKEMYGRDAAWAALIVGAFSNRAISIAREGRYYSATVMLGTACCLMLWRMYAKGRWRDFVIGGVVFALTFHTHVITFLVASAAFVVMLPFIVREGRRRAAAARASEGNESTPVRWCGAVCRKVLAFGAIVVGSTLPWALWSGFFTQASDIPRAWRYLQFPEDFFTFPLWRPYLLVLLAVGAVALICAELFRRRLPKRFVHPFVVHRGAFHFLACWALLGYLAFIFLMPAISYTFGRMTLPILGPGLVLAAMIFAAVVRFVLRRPSRMLASALFLAFMFVFADTRPWRVPYNSQHSEASMNPEMVDWLREHPLRRGTRVYSTPNRHLIYSVYTGIPIQSVAPVRKQFLDEFPGDIVVIEDVLPFQRPPADAVRAAAVGAGRAADVAEDDEVEEMRWRVLNRAVRERVATRVQRVHPPLLRNDLPDYLMPLAQTLPEWTAGVIRESGLANKRYPAIFRPYTLPDWSFRWQYYFYRFADPERRVGANLNYADRIRRGEAWVTEYGSTIYLSTGDDRASR